MTLTESIKTNPYLKVGNCLDLSDVDYAISECRELERRFGEKKTIKSILGRLLIKRNRLLSDKKCYSVIPKEVHIEISKWQTSDKLSFSLFEAIKLISEETGVDKDLIFTFRTRKEAVDFARDYRNKNFCICKSVSECKGYGTPNCLIR